MRILNIFNPISYALLGAIVAAGHCHAQSSQSPSVLTPKKVHAYLRQPQGLEKLSNEFGDITLDAGDPRWTEYDLTSLAANSTIVFRGEVESCTGVLEADGDSIHSDCIFHISDLMKGPSALYLTVSIQGGKVKLPNGHTVTLTSEAYTALQSGSSYFFFLQREGDHYRPVGGSQGILSITSAPDAVHLIVKSPTLNQSLRKQLEGSTAATASARIMSALQQ